MPPSNYSTWNTPDFLRVVMSKLMHRDPVTGAPLNPEAESAMPHHGITAWGEAHVILHGCTILNMSYNGVCCTGSSNVVIHDCVISGCGMAGVYMEGQGNATLTSCLLKVCPYLSNWKAKCVGYYNLPLLRVLQDNYICLSVWGGFGVERLFKTSTDLEDDEPALVDPKCSMRLVRNRLCGRAWAGEVRPLHLEEIDNLFEEGGEKMEDLTEEEPDEEGLESLVEVEDAPGAKVCDWRIRLGARFVS